MENFKGAVKEWRVEGFGGNRDRGLSGRGELKAQQQQRQQQQQGQQQQQRGMRERAAWELTVRHQSSVTRTESAG